MLMLAVLGHATASEQDRSKIVDFFLRYFPTQFEFLTSQLDALRGQRVTPRPRRRPARHLGRARRVRRHHDRA